MTLEQLYDRAVVVASMRQTRFAAAVGDRIWWVDPQNSVAKMFTRDRQPASEVLPIRILGTEGDGEWLWAWANMLNFPMPASRSYSEQLREHGARLGIAELTTPRLPVDNVACAQTFAIIALAMPGTGGYVLHRAGPITAAFVLGEPFVEPDPADLVGIGKAIANVLGGSHPYSNALDVIDGTFDTLGLSHERQGETVRARDGSGRSITISIEGGNFRCEISPS